MVILFFNAFRGIDFLRIDWPTFAEPSFVIITISLIAQNFSLQINNYN